jgi:hypothetical protein
MKFDMEEEVELMPHSKKSMGASPKGKLSSGQKTELEEARAVIERIASESGRSVEDLMHGSAEEPADEMDEMDEESEGQEESEEDGEMEEPKEKGKKLALYIAQMRSKRG